MKNGNGKWKLSSVILLHFEKTKKLRKSGVQSQPMYTLKEPMCIGHSKHERNKGCFRHTYNSPRALSPSISN